MNKANRILCYSLASSFLIISCVAIGLSLASLQDTAGFSIVFIPLAGITLYVALALALLPYIRSRKTRSKR